MTLDGADQATAPLGRESAARADTPTTNAAHLVDGMSTPSIGGSLAHRDRLAWVLIAAAVLAQYVLFRGFVQREVAPVYPGMYDQAGYLYMTYSLHEDIRDHGFVTGAQTAWKQRMPQTLLFMAEGALLMLLTGGSRLGALSLGFLHFAALQGVLAFTLRRLSGGWTAALLAVGLLLSTRTAFGWGGIADFRLDFIAMCLYGILLCAGLASDTLARRRGWLYVGAAAAYLALFRYLTIVYLLGLFLGFGALLALASWRWVQATPRWSARWRGLRLSLLALALAVLPVFWANWEHLRNYYWRDQRGVAVIQQSVSGGNTLAAWLVNFTWLRDEHLGDTFLALACTTLVVGWLATQRQRNSTPTAPSALVPFDAVTAALFLVLAVSVPLTVLTLNPARSPIVSGIVVPGLVLLVVLPVVVAVRRGAGALSRRLLSVLATVSMTAGIVAQAAFYVHHPPASERADQEEATQLLVSSAKVCRDLGWRNPIFFSDATSEFSQPNAAAILSYEHLGWFFNPVAAAPGGSAWLPARPKDARAAFRAADIVFLARRMPPGYEPAYPFDRSVASVRRAWPAQAERDLVLIERRTVQNWAMEAYARPAASMIEPVLPPGEPWTWVTDAGLTFRSSAMLLRARPWLRLEGQARFDWLGGEMPGVRATLIPESGAPFTVPVSTLRHDTAYLMDVFCDPAKLAPAGRVLVHLDFDRSFRPVDVGMSPDTQHIVMAAPLSARLLGERPQPPDWAASAAVGGR
jgi:hypothetical protein